MKLTFLCAIVAAMTLGGCQVQPPVNPSLEVPTDGAQVCANHCQTMGLQLASVVLMGNQMGCVCAPASQVGPGLSVATDSGAAGVAAGALIARQQAEEDQRRSQQSRH